MPGHSVVLVPHARRAVRTPFKVRERARESRKWVGRAGLRGLEWFATPLSCLYTRSAHLDGPCTGCGVASATDDCVFPATREGGSLEAHISTEQSPACPQARVQGADARTRGASDHQGAAKERPSPAGRLDRMATTSAVRPVSLRSSREIAAVLRSRNRRAGERVVLHARRVGGHEPARVAVVASRKVGSAVVRNRAKRLMREAARQVDWKRGTDFVIVARRECAESTSQEVGAEVVALAQALDLIEQR
jgi:ribonuclease P protein component